MRFLLLITFTSIALTLLACSTPHKQAEEDLADTTVWNNRSDIEMRILDNRHLSRVQGMDTILCEHVAGASGVVYFEEALWANISIETKRSLTECLDLHHNLKVHEVPLDGPPVPMWTARLNNNDTRLQVGSIRSNCISCTLSEAPYEFEILRKDTLYFPRKLTEAEMWR